MIKGDVPRSTTESAAGKLTQADLIEEVSRVVELQWQEAAILVERILDSMVHAIERGDKVEIRGFGSFRNWADRLLHLAVDPAYYRRQNITDVTQRESSRTRRSFLKTFKVGQPSPRSCRLPATAHPS